MEVGISEVSLLGGVYLSRGCGLDIHKKTVVACIMGHKLQKQIRTFSTFTDDLLELKRWLKSSGISHVAMESTGVYCPGGVPAEETDFQSLVQFIERKYRRIHHSLSNRLITIVAANIIKCISEKVNLVIKTKV